MPKHTGLFLFFFCCLGLGLHAQTGQIAIPRVELMPNQPTPYNVRDWKQVALRYDSFVYDVTKTGQYLPITQITPAGVNYPQNSSFRMHTYVGTNSPLGNEAINVLPSLVGASLAGIDKTSQFGRNWLLMSQDFFNKNNGENLYLNNPSTTSGNDWWYDMMPNVYFYQLYDLYPGLSAESDYQFTAIADQFLAAVRAMGGHDAPWEPAFMNYRAWKFKTMEPNANGVKEPEAAGAFAWVLYHAWKTTGNPEYLKAAEWSMEFLSNWTSNPSYELQLPYGTYTAAKMNAEIGTAYDIQKMLNWSFDRGPLRGWGAIVGTKSIAHLRRNAEIVDRGPLPADVDRDQWLSLLTNLLFNAIDATPGGGSVGVAAGPRVSAGRCLSPYSRSAWIEPSAPRTTDSSPSFWKCALSATSSMAGRCCRWRCTWTCRACLLPQFRSRPRCRRVLQPSATRAAAAGRSRHCGAQSAKRAGIDTAPICRARLGPPPRQQSQRATALQSARGQHRRQHRAGGV